MSRFFILFLYILIFIFTYSCMGMYYLNMPRALNTYDTFTAIAEPKRRELIETLIGHELCVTQMVDITQWTQPMVSKHLKVLKQAGLVSERKDGRKRVYKVNADQLKPIQIWIAQFEKHWNTQFEQLDHYLQDLQMQEDTNE